MGLQGRDKTVIDFVEQTHSFQIKLDLFTMDLSAGRMLHFPMLRKRISAPAQVTAAMTEFITKLKDNFAS